MVGRLQQLGYIYKLVRRYNCWCKYSPKLPPKNTSLQRVPSLSLCVLVSLPLYITLPTWLIHHCPSSNLLVHLWVYIQISGLVLARETFTHLLATAAPATLPLIQQHLNQSFRKNTKLDFLDYQSSSLNLPASYRIHPTKKCNSQKGALFQALIKTEIESQRPTSNNFPTVSAGK